MDDNKRTAQNHEYVDENYAEFCKEKYYLDTKNQKVQTVYYNFDSNAGGQIVCDDISFDILKAAFNDCENEEEFWDYVDSYAYQTLTDITTPEWESEAKAFVENPCDYMGRNTNTMEALRKLVFPVQEKYGVITIDNIEKFIGKTVDCQRRLFHHYPLTFKKMNSNYFYVDRVGVMIHFNKEDKIRFDSVADTPAKLSKHKNRNDAR